MTRPHLLDGYGKGGKEKRLLAALREVSMEGGVFVPEYQELLSGVSIACFLLFDLSHFPFYIFSLFLFF